MKKVLAASALGFILFSFPTATFAASSRATFFGPIVPTECLCTNQVNPTPGQPAITTAPDYGCVLQVIQNVINLAISLGIILFVLYATFAGFRLVTSGGSSEAVSQGRTRLLNVVVGMTVLLTSWLIVDFVMKTLYNQGANVGQGAVLGPWNGILASQSSTDKCIVAKNSVAITTGAPAVITGAQTAGGTGSSAQGASGLNVPAATQYADQAAQPKATGYCARYVCEALNAGGAHIGCANAYQMGSVLSSAGFSSVYTGTYNGSSFAAQAGDVVVFQQAQNQSKAQYGHIAIFDGSQWVSDFKQSSMGFSKYNGISYTIYRP